MHQFLAITMPDKSQAAFLQRSVQIKTNYENRLAGMAKTN